MWKMQIATYKDNLNGTHTETHRSEAITFPTRFDAEIYISDIVEANTDRTVKYLGFIDSPWGDHYTCDPSHMFWQDYHLLIT